MNPLAVVAYPRLEPGDAAWIEAFRAEHDPQAGLIRAHLTLVFPLVTPAAPLVAHARAVAQGCAPIALVLDHARAVLDAVGGGAHVFLVPEQAGDAVIDLHDRLYTGALAAWLRADVPFTPHLTVAHASTLDEAARLAATLGARPLRVGVRIDTLEVVAVARPSVKTIEAIALTGSSPARRT